MEFWFWGRLPVFQDLYSAFVFAVEGMGLGFEISGSEFGIGVSIFGSDI